MHTGRKESLLIAKKKIFFLSGGHARGPSLKSLRPLADPHGSLMRIVNTRSRRLFVSVFLLTLSFVIHLLAVVLRPIV